MKSVIVFAVLAFAILANGAERRISLLAPSDTKSVRLAADAFADVWEKVTDERPAIVSEFPAEGDVIVFGEEEWNRFTFARRLDGKLPPNTLRNGSDAYRLISQKDGERTLLFLLNARPRSLFYAVYRFFELRADCSWFWDGDRIPKGPAPDIGGLDITELPRFDWRGLRYFAHRSLHRFQAEHWTLDDWKHEVDWMLKRRLNLFMLRIGQDDLFQKAFPDIVPYDDNSWDPIGGKPDESYNDRSLFWPLKARAAIRKGIMDYAHDRDLVHVADTGTMTHWYSRTPKVFMEKAKPDFLKGHNAKEGEYNGSPSTLVWDVEQDKWLDAYWKLTQSDVDYYSGSDMFHTIGLSERGFYRNDDGKNFRLKLSVYRRIIAKLREHYPDAPLLVGSWDFREHWRWSPERVREFVATLNPANTLILDYIADLPEAQRNSFTQWGIVGKFPWIFGIFHAYEAHNDMRGNYPQIQDRFPIAVDDPMCKGVVLWPENSHQDTLMLDYFSVIGWDPSQYRIEEFLPAFCRRRYGAEKSALMLALWRQMLPVLPSDSWHLCCGPVEPLYGDYPAAYARFRGDVFCNLNDRRLRYFRDREKTLAPLRDGMTSLLGDLAALDWAGTDEWVRRDCIDMTRAVLGRLLEGEIAELGLAIDERLKLPLESSQERVAAANDAIRQRLARFREYQIALADVLETMPEFSLYDSLSRIQAVKPFNPNFERTLKENSSIWYCRSQIYEQVRYLGELDYDVLKEFLERVMAKSDGFVGWRAKENDLNLQFDDVRSHFFGRPLSEMKPQCEAALVRLSKTLEKVAALSAGKNEDPYAHETILRDVSTCAEAMVDKSARQAGR